MKWLFRRRQPVEVPLDPAQVIIVKFLFRFKAAPELRLWEEVGGTLYRLSRREFSQALAELASRNIVEPRIQPESGETWFVIGPLGRRIKGKIPYEVKGAIVIYV